MHWQFYQPEESTVLSLQSALSCSEIIARIIANRKLFTKEETKTFFNPDLNGLHDPFLMQDMQLAVERVLQSIKKQTAILVFGDYDVDGTTAAAMLFLALKVLGAKVFTYIPNRESEGYGLSARGIKYAEKIGADLIITCDCGINANEPVAFAKSLNIDVIITDHHIPDANLPEAYAILNPKRPDCNYPFKGLCGGGVAFKLASALTNALGKPATVYHEFLDLITMGTAADMVPIIDENRIIVSHGLPMLADSIKPGIKALFEKSGIRTNNLTVGQLIFGIAPKINAAGRLGDANRSVELLTTTDEHYAEKLATELTGENKRRQQIQQDVVNEALLMVNSQIDLQNDRAVVLAETGWHPGVVGIVASKVKDEYHRPAVIISFDENGAGKGSARSISGLDLYAALSAVSMHLDDFGGHPMAAGLSISKDKYPQFKQAFLDYANNNLSAEQLIPSILLDGEIALGDINPRFMDFLQKLSPYGPGNMRPKVCVRQLEVVGSPQMIGNGEHLRFKVRKDGRVINAIGFGQAPHYEKLIKGFPVDLACVVETNEWRGHSTIQLNVRDIKLSEPT
ncbi:single-stranded-DNA-specific exonuclease RecJ [Candidatus Neomarinimicrobiota bacterium]